MLSSKLTVGVHILTLLALTPDQAQTSEYIAGSVNTNPVCIRRLLGRLREAGIVESQGGIGGGWRLRVPAGRITLLDVLRAVEPQGETISLHPSEPKRSARWVGTSRASLQRSMARSSGGWTSGSPRRPSRASWARSKNGNGAEPFFCPLV